MFQSELDLLYGCSHAALVQRAVSWLRGALGCVVATAKTKSITFEEPDAIGWTGAGVSHVVECKRSRSDFRADKKKPHRTHEIAHEILAMGNYRWYLTPPKLLNMDNLPPFWGLAEVHKSKILIIKPAILFVSRHWLNEMKILVGFIPRPAG